MEAPAVVDLSDFLAHDPAAPLTPELTETVNLVTASFRDTGILIVKDPRF
jgi:hypothetical protein